MARYISSATERALARTQNGQVAHEAARAEGIAPSTIYRAIKRLKEADDMKRELRITVSYTLPRSMVEWLKSHDFPASRIVEEAIKTYRTSLQQSANPTNSEVMVGLDSKICIFATRCKY